MLTFSAWSGPANRTAGTSSAPLCISLGRRPHETLLRDIVLFGLYLCLGQLLVLDGTVMFAYSIVFMMTMCRAVESVVHTVGRFCSGANGHEPTTRIDEGKSEVLNNNGR
jgi:hypothetical protein